jgi:hypothetical protein
VDADTLRHLGDGSARIEDEANGLILVLLGEVPACRHAISSAAISGSLRPVVYKIGNGSTASTMAGALRHGLVLGQMKYGLTQPQTSGTRVKIAVEVGGVLRLF